MTSGAAPWIGPAKLVAQRGVAAEIRCPINDDDFLDIRWNPISGQAGGEIHLRCPTCGHETFILTSEPPHGL